MTLLNSWAQRWGVSPEALRDLYVSLAAADGPPPTPSTPPASEAAVQARVRVAASAAGMRVWRNNVGAFHDAERGIHVRFGLANDSPQVNKLIKSADLIGIKPRVIHQHDVGVTIGQFISLECKHAGWKFKGDEHEQAQAAWAALVTSLGGIARFVTDPSGAAP